MRRKKDVHVKMSREERGALEAFMARHGLTQSQAVRSLIAMALERAAKANDALVKAVYGEGYQAAQIEIRKRVGVFLATLNHDLDDAVRDLPRSRREGDHGR